MNESIAVAKDPIGFLLQFVAALMLIAVITVTWAGVTYPNGRTKASSSDFSKIHPMCIHRVLIDDRYESSINLDICHAEYAKHPIIVESYQSRLGDQTMIRVSSTRTSQEGHQWLIGYSLAGDDGEQDGPFLVNLFIRSPKGKEFSSLAGVSHHASDSILNAHFIEGMGDRCQGGHIELMGMANRNEIALSQSATLYALINPMGQLLKREENSVRTSFPDWKANDPISHSPTECVGRLIGLYDHVSETASVKAIAVDHDALLRQSRNSTEACVADAIVRFKDGESFESGAYSIYELTRWNDVLIYVHQRCGINHAFNPINSGI